MADEEEDDYMTMALPSVPQSETTTSLSRAQRRREDSTRGHIQSKRAAEHERLKRLERGLGTSLDADHEQEPGSESKSKSKGAAMLAKLGYKGGPLGRPSSTSTVPSAVGVESAGEVKHEQYDPTNTTARSGVKDEVKERDSRLVNPIRVQVKNNRHGIGVAAEEESGLKRAREALEQEQQRTKRLRGEIGGYRERTGREGRERKVEGQWWGAMRVIETLREQGTERRDVRPDDENDVDGKGGVPHVLMPLVKQREEGEEMKRTRRMREERLARAEVGDEGDDEDSKVALGKTLGALPELPGSGEEDEELEEYMALSVEERLDRTVMWLREKYWYCFWCKARYDEKELEGCPGVTEEDHD